MSELRLVPAALAVWLASLACILSGARAAAAAVACLAVACCAARQWGQAVLVALLGSASAVVALVRLRAARTWVFPHRVVGEVSGQPKQLQSGAWLVRLRVEGYPSTLSVFADDLPAGAVPGAGVEATGRLRPSTFPGVSREVLTGTVEVTNPPRGLAAFAQHVRATFGESVAAHTGPASRGLIPGMVLGDTSAQTAAEQQAYVDTGLSHLSAVSGANVAIITTFAVVAATALRLGLRARLAAAAAALLGFAALVGPEPSVLRASVTGLVGLIAVVSTRRAEPLHALCLSVIVLVLVDSDLAVHYGFALSVAATAGIVALYPLLYRALAPTGWPDILVRALAIAVAADVVTMPIVALMAGRVSLVSVLANVLVAPVTAAVTVLGLTAAALSLAPGGLEAPLLALIEPLTWWVHKVAVMGAGLPVATISATPAAVAVCYGWVLAGLLAHRPRLTAGAVAAVLAVSQVQLPQAPLMDISSLRAHVVATRADIEPVPPGTQLVVVLEAGSPTKRPTVTPAGIPAVFPNRDGPVLLRTDGTREIYDGPHAQPRPPRPG